MKFTEISRIVNWHIYRKIDLKTDIILEDCVVFTDPYEEADEQLKKEREEEQEKQQKETEQVLKKKKPSEETSIKVYKQGVGKYINSSSVKRALAASTDDETISKKKKNAYEFGNFTSW
ncbi:peptidyl-prolyl cis-trans isomerase-like 2 [Biomphalaria pfeifferi]|uniref:Peptidyl-prolyl cis-trans isomerase-like 2 n=1 Tax=Biomphalaria pfeifferi TaxID=112525 RepID=A0AAD8BHZ6_BIOPF|nr:peptidyl-prolyl cis-trans isomerase-like 2 [Biomphalaria pfeifferi]